MTVKLSNGMNIKEFCREHKMDYSSIRKRIQDWGMTPEEAKEDYFNWKKGHPPYKWFYEEGKPLAEVCRERGLNYRYVITGWKHLKNRTGTLKEYVDNYLNKDSRIFFTKYCCHGVSLFKYCKQNKLDYNKLRVFYLENKDKFTVEEAVEEWKRKNPQPYYVTKYRNYRSAICTEL